MVPYDDQGAFDLPGLPVILSGMTPLKLTLNMNFDGVAIPLEVELHETIADIQRRTLLTLFPPEVVEDHMARPVHHEGIELVPSHTVAEANLKNGAMLFLTLSFD